MERRRIGSLDVSVVGLGCNNFGWRIGKDASREVIAAALDGGVNFLDTADMYDAGVSEEFLGEALGSRRKDVVLATKFHIQMGRDVNQQGNSRRWIRQEVENSLRRLGTDRIDLYQVHRPAPNCDIDETLGALTDLVNEGKVLSIGSSTFPASEIVEAQWVAERRGRERFVCEQPPYSILVRGIETDVLPTCARYNMGVIPWSPLAGGWLSGKWRRGGETLTSRRAERLPGRYDLSLPENQRKLEAAFALGDLADEIGMPLPHLAVAFVMNHPTVTSAIIGPRTMEQLTSQLGAVDVVLTKEVLDRIDAIVAPGTNFSASDGGYIPPSVADARKRRRVGA